MKFLGHIEFLYIREEKLSRQLGKEVYSMVLKLGYSLKSLVD